MQKEIKDVFQDYKKENNIVNATIQKINLYKKSNKLEIEIFSQNQLTIEELADFETYLSERFTITTVMVNVKYPEITLIHTIQEDWEKIMKYIATKFPVTKAILKGSTPKIEENNVIINLKNKSSAFLHAHSVDLSLERLFMNVYGKKYRVTYEENITEEDIIKQQNFLEQIQENVCKNLLNNMTVVAEEKKKVEKQEKKKDIEEQEEDTPLILGRVANIKEQIVKIKELTADYGRVALQGKVIRTDSRELRNGKTLVMFDVYDGTSTITCKSFVEPEKIQKVMSRIKPKTRIKLQGDVRI